MSGVDFEQARNNMIEQQIRPWDVSDDHVLDLIRHIPREDFVPEAYRNIAFADMQIPLGHGEVMMEPKQEARLLQAVNVQPGETVLEVGTGSGYLTALLASLAGHVYSVELNPALLKQAEAKLKAQRIDNVTLEEGNAASGWKPHSPYDVIIFTGSLPVLDPAILHSLNVGGRLFAIIGEEPLMEATLFTRTSHEAWREEPLFETVIPPLRGIEIEKKFEF